LPRNFPFVLPMAWLSALIGGPAVGKLIIVAGFATAFVGAARLVGDVSLVTQLGAGALYAFNPFMLTRVGVGHLTLFAAAAILPWALPTLLRPTDDLRRTFLWSCAMGTTGFVGALLAGPTVVVGVVADRGRSWWRVVGVFVVSQLPWVVAGVLASTGGFRLASADHFRADVRNVAGLARLFAGFGFWDPGQQVSLRLGAFASFLGLGLLVLGVAGARALPHRWGTRATWLAAFGVVAALGTRMPLTGRLYDVVNDTTLGQAVRESQRLLPLYLCWLAPAAALGARRIARAAPAVLTLTIAAVPLAVILVLAGPGLWGLNDRLSPASFPASWSRADDATSRAPGTVLALPFSEYLDLGFAGNRRVLNPIPAYFGGDVVFSSDPELGERAQEGSDPRETPARRVVDRMERGARTSPQLAALGIRWVVLAHEDNWRDFRSLRHDHGLEHVVATPSLDLYRVRAWRGPARDSSGAAIAVHTPIAPVAFFDSDAAATWYRPATDGWLRGLSPVHQTASGLLRVDSGSGVVWYWPALLAVSASLLTLSAFIVVLLRVRATRRPDGCQPSKPGLRSVCR
jgi:hypothetical protein